MRREEWTIVVCGVTCAQVVMASLLLSVRLLVWTIITVCCFYVLYYVSETQCH